MGKAPGEQKRRIRQVRHHDADRTPDSTRRAAAGYECRCTSPGSWNQLLDHSPFEPPHEWEPGEVEEGHLIESHRDDYSRGNYYAGGPPQHESSNPELDR
jgi:hypothetical protein